MGLKTNLRFVNTIHAAYHEGAEMNVMQMQSQAGGYCGEAFPNSDRFGRGSDSGGLGWIPGPQKRKPPTQVY